MSLQLLRDDRECRADSDSFMIDMMDYPSMMRNVMVAGHIHHGKTSLLDMLVLETHQLAWDADRAVRSRPESSAG